MRITAIVLVMVLFAGAAWAEDPCTGKARQSGGHIGIYSDSPGFSDCNLNETLYLNNYFYVVHTLAPEANTSQFAVIHNWNDAIIGGVTYGSNLQLGDIFTGVTVTYVGCKPLPHLLATMSFIPISPTPECTMLVVVPDPNLPSGEIEVVDCASSVLHATGGYGCVNTWDCCGCGPPDRCELPVATKETSWGAVKALYR